MARFLESFRVQEEGLSLIRVLARFLVLPGILLYLFLFCADKRIPMTDEGVMVILSREVLEGRSLYEFVDSPYSPFSFVLHAGWMKIAGASLIAGRAATLLLAAGTWLAFYFGLRTAANRATAFLGSSAAVLATFPYQFFASYNNYGMFFVAASGAAILASSVSVSIWPPLLAGALASASFLCKQNLGALALAGGFTALFFNGVMRRSFRATGAFVGGAVVGASAVFILCAPFVDLPGMFDQAFFGALEQGEHHASPYPSDQLARLAQLITAPGLAAVDGLAHSFSFIMPFVIATLLAARALFFFRSKDKRSAPAVVCAVLAAFHGLGSVHAPTTWHVIFSKPVPILAGAYLFYTLIGSRTGRALVMAVTAGFFLLHVGRQVMIMDDYTASVDSPAADGIFLRDWEASVINAGLRMIESVPRDEPVFIAAPDPMYYYFTQRQPPIPQIYLDPPLVSPAEKAEIQRTLADKQVRYILYPHGRNAYYDYGAIIEGYGKTADVKSESIGSITVELRRIDLGEDLERPGAVGEPSDTGPSKDYGPGIRPVSGEPSS